MRFRDRVAFVTGGANGIGEGIVEALLEGGASVVVADMNVEAGTAQRERLRAAGHRVEFFRTDVASEADVAEACSRTLEIFGKVDILVNDAGWKRAGLAHTLSEEDWNRSMAIHLNGTWLTVKHLVPSMVKNGGGAIVNISSMQALLSLPGRAVYSAAKGAISALTRQLAVEYGPANIRVNAVMPGAILTGRKLQNQAADFKGDRLKLALKVYPLRRFGTPRDIANAVCFLASDEASWITGINLPVDGGGLVQLGEAVISATDENYWNQLAEIMPK
jgi:NAD(P)-dependent dehydrogenase (short-subunit alcohol dehydrogenase family)